jgi:hypothetical protein
LQYYYYYQQQIDIAAPVDSFGTPIFVPTHNGWSFTPGCIESYSATAIIKVYETNVNGTLDECTMPLAALEFGGEYQNT